MENDGGRSRTAYGVDAGTECADTVRETSPCQAWTRTVRFHRTKTTASCGFPSHFCCTTRLEAGNLRYNRCAISRGVAQPGSAPALGAGGPEFESRRPDQKHLACFL
jgi:hypothetical protein